MLVTRRLPVLAVGPVVEAVARHHHLADDLAGGEIAHQPLRAGVAERAVQRAADLGGDAQRAAVGLGDVDALDLMRPLDIVAARQPQQPFAGAVGRDLLGHHFGPVDGEMLFELGAHVLRDVGHLGKGLWRRAHRSSARAAARASCAARARRRSRRGARPARRATARSATALPAAHRFRAAVFSNGAWRQWSRSMWQSYSVLARSSGRPSGARKAANSEHEARRRPHGSMLRIASGMTGVEVFK